MEKSKTAIFRLESSLWESKRSQYRNKIHDSPNAIRRVLSRINETLKIQSLKVPKLTLSRIKRDLYQLKHRALLDSFRREKSALSLQLCDGESTIIQYYARLFKYQSNIQHFLYSYELFLNSFYYKSYLRLTGYPKILIDVLHDHPPSTNTGPMKKINENNQHSEYLWQIYCNIVLILSNKDAQYEIIIPNYDSNNSNNSNNDMMTIFILLQYFEILYSRNYPNLTKINLKNEIHHYFQFCIQVLYRLYDLLITSTTSNPDIQGVVGLVGESMTISTIYKTENTHQVELISMILTQCCHTMRILLMNNQYQLRKLRPYTTSLEYIKYHTEISDILIKWINIITWNRQYPCRRSRENNLHVPIPTTTTPTTTTSSPEYYCYPLTDYYTSYTNTLITDILINTKCILQILLFDSNILTIRHGLYSKENNYSYQSLTDKYLPSIEKLINIIIRNISYYSNTKKRLCIGDIRIIESIHSEYIACLSCLSVLFSLGYMNKMILKLLYLCKKISQQYHAVNTIQSHWLQTLLSGILCLNILSGSGGGGGSSGGGSHGEGSGKNDNEITNIITRITEAKLLDLRHKINNKRSNQSNDNDEEEEEEDDDEGEEGENGKNSSSALKNLPLYDQYYLFYGSNIHNLIKLLAYHLTSPFIQHLGLLIIRLILRCPYLSKKEIEIFLEGNQLTQEEINEQKKLLKKELKEKYKLTSEMKSKERVVIPSITTENDTGTGGTGSGGGGDVLVDINAMNDNDDDISIESISEWKEKTWDDDNILLDNDEDQLLVNDLGCTHEQIVSHGHGGHGGLYYHPITSTSTTMNNDKYDIKKKKISHENQNNEKSTTGNGSGSTSGGGHTSSNIDKNHIFLYRTLHELKLSDLLKLIGENNMQSKETIEQWLLLVYHIANGTPLARQTLVNSYIDETLYKLLSIQTNDYYIMALCEMSLNILSHHEAD